MTETTLEQLHHPAHTHRVFLADSIGCLRVAHAPSFPLPGNYAGPPVRTVVLPGFRSHSEHAVHRLAAGHLHDGTWIIAMARKNATIDLVHISDADASTSSSAAGATDVQATILATITENRMRAGIERWVGLAVGANGVYSCTSAGSFRFTPVAAPSTGAELLGQPKLLDLPGPLQHCCFYPASNPTHFSYAGEEVPPSLWDAAVALSEQPQSMVGDESSDSIVASDGMNAKMRKRKRQAEAKAKAREYAWGEVWRAKNLPNDYLSLPQRANVAQVAIVDMDSDAIATAGGSDAAEGGAVPPRTTIVVGTKDGLIRVFEPSGGSRKHTREHRILPQGQGGVKTMSVGRSIGELFVADTSGKLFAVDWRNGQIQYQYKDITGAINSLLPLPSPLSPTTSAPIGHPLLLSTSQDKLVRLHTTQPPPAEASKTSKPESKSKVRGETLWTCFSSTPSSTSSALTTVTGAVWDGKVPVSLVALEKPVRRRQRKEGEGFDGVEDGESDEESEVDDDEEDEVWATMKEVGVAAKKDKKGATSPSHDEGDEEQEAEGRREEKRKKSRK